MGENGAVRVGSMIRQRRLELGMTQAQLTEKVELVRNQMQLSSIERGERKPRTAKSKYDEVLADIAGVLGITFDDDGNETKPIGDLIDEYNGKRTVFEQFKEVRTTISNMRKSIQSLFVSATVSDATDMDHGQKLDTMKAEIMDIRAENKRIVEENSQIKHNITVTIERLMRLERERDNAS